MNSAQARDLVPMPPHTLRWKLTWRWLRTCWALMAIMHTLANWSSAGEVRLKNGMVFNGRPTSIQTLSGGKRDGTNAVSVLVWMIDEPGVVRTYVPLKQAQDVNRDNDEGQFETFTLPQKKGRAHIVERLGTLRDATPFDEFGRRIATVTVGGKDATVIQGVTTITPQYLKVIGVTHAWEFGIPTSSVPAKTLDAMLRTAIEQDDPEQRLAIVRFYMQADRDDQAQDELDAIRREFPTLSRKTDELAAELTELRAKQFLDELKRRRGAGQFEMAHEMAQNYYEKNRTGEILAEARELLIQSDTEHERVGQCQQLLGELQAALPAELATRVAPLHDELSGKLACATLNRVDAFLDQAATKNLKPDEKLALAFSGWILGSANAISDLDAVLRLWHARLLILSYLRTDEPSEREAILSQLKWLEGVTPKQVAQMLPLLPPTIETPDLPPGTIGNYEAPAENDAAPIPYGALLPLEYRAGRAYPLIVALHAESQGLDSALEWWGGTREAPGGSQLNGYIVIAPEYAAHDQLKYDYSGHAHNTVIAAIRDARRRFHVDSDRIYLSGHAMGGDAAFDIGCAHPDLFAGVMPIAGVCDKYCTRYWPNAEHLPFYVIGGELDRAAAVVNSRNLAQMMLHGFDLIYVEHVGRGREKFDSDASKLFEWMPRHKRVKYPKEIDEIKTLRPTDNHFWWWEFCDMPSQAICLVWPEEKTRISPLSVRARITSDNTIQLLQCPGHRQTLSLSPDLVDFDKKVRVELRGVQKFNKLLEPDIATMLEDFRLRSDRQKPIWAKLEL